MNDKQNAEQQSQPKMKTNVHQLMNDKQNAEDLSAITRNEVTKTFRT